MTAYVSKAVYARSQAVAGVTAIIGARFYPLTLPQDGVLPAAVYRVTGGSVVSAMGGDTGLTRKSIQIMALATDVSVMRALVEELRIAYQRYRGTIGGVTVRDIFIEDIGAEGYDDTLQCYWGSIDLVIWHEA